MKDYEIVFVVNTNQDNEKDAIADARELIADRRFEPASVEVLGQGDHHA